MYSATGRQFGRSTSCVFAAAISLVLVKAGAHAQTTTTTADETVEMAEMIVTGSNIPTAADAVMVPVKIIGQANFEATGLGTNVMEMLQKSMPLFSGNGNLGLTNANVGVGNTYGGAQISLRNLDTLVLINGRRIANNGAGARGGRNFVDVSQIPASAIERIEVLSDGASAIYGSDAVGGVVNIILRSSYRGLEVGGRYGFADTGSYEERSGYFVAGTGGDRWSLTLSGSMSKTDPLLQKDRAFSTPIYGRTSSIAGAVLQGGSSNYYLDPSLTSPSERNPTGTAATAPNMAALVSNGTYTRYNTTAEIAALWDLSRFPTLVFKKEDVGLCLTTDIKLIPDRLEFFADLMVARNEAFSQLAAQPVTGVTVPAGSPFNPLTVAVTSAVNRFEDYPRQYFTDGDITRATAGIRGRLNENWRWEVAATFNDAELQYENANVIYGPNRDLAIRGGYNASGAVVPGGAYSRVFTNFAAPPIPASVGTSATAQTNWLASQITAENSVLQPALDFLARGTGVDPASLENILGVAVGSFESTLDQFDAKIAGTPFVLPAGRVGFATGFGFVKESLEGTPDENSRSTDPDPAFITRQRWAGATFFDPFNRDREIKSGYVELRVPVAGGDFRFPGVKALDLSAAYRIDDYSDAPTAKVPKFGLRWQPLDEQLTIRANYAESFSAPTLFRLFGPTSQGFTATAVIPNVFGINGQAQQRTGSNPNLRPSTAEIRAIGFVVSPKVVKGLTFSVDFVDADQVDVVSTVGSTTILQSVNALGAASPYHAQVAFDAFPGEPGARLVSAPGELRTHLVTQGNPPNTVYVSDVSTNIAGQRVKTVDVSLDYEWATREWGTVTFNSTGTFFLDYRFQELPDQPYYEYAGHITNGGVGSQGTVPGYKFYNTLRWNRKGVGVLIGYTYIPSLVDLGPGGSVFVASTTLQRIPVDSYQSFDVALNYSMAKTRYGFLRWLEGSRLTVGVNNALDEDPPLSPQAYNESNVDISTYGVIGRLFYLSFAKKF